MRKPNDNAHIERFNRTLQEECTDRAPLTISHLRDAIAAYLPYYNTERLHLGLGFKTPAQMLKVVPRC